MKSLLIKLDNELKTEFHKLCVEEGLTMTEVIRELIKKFIQQQK